MDLTQLHNYNKRKKHLLMLKKEMCFKCGAVSSFWKWWSGQIVLTVLWNISILHSYWIAVLKEKIRRLFYRYIGCPNTKHSWNSRWILFRSSPAGTLNFTESGHFVISMRPWETVTLSRSFQMQFKWNCNLSQ